MYFTDEIFSLYFYAIKFMYVIEIDIKILLILNFI